MNLVLNLFVKWVLSMVLVRVLELISESDHEFGFAMRIVLEMALGFSVLLAMFIGVCFALVLVVPDPDSCNVN